MVNYGKITPLLVKAIQEQQQQIEALKAQVAKMNEMEAMMKQLQIQIEDMNEMKKRRSKTKNITLTPNNIYSNILSNF